MLNPYENIFVFFVLNVFYEREAEQMLRLSWFSSLKA